MLGVELNKNPDSKISSVLFGFCQIGDGLVRIFSFGFAHSRWALNYAKWQAQRHIKKSKKS